MVFENNHTREESIFHFENKFMIEISSNRGFSISMHVLELNIARYEYGIKI